MTSPFLSIKEAADYLRVDYKTIYRLVRAGQLPAAQIGSVYRIRREDLEEFFERRRVRATSTGRAIRQEQAIRADSDRPSFTCGRCGRIIPAGEAPGGPCSSRDCDALLCRGCWIDYPDHYCAVHRPTQPDKLEAARAQLQAGQLSVLVTALEARQREAAFIASFERKVYALPSVRHPITGQVYRISDWNQRRVLQDDSVAVMNLLSVANLEPNLAERLPANAWLRFRVGHSSGRTTMVLDGRVFSHLAEHVNAGFDTRPASLEEVTQALKQASEQAETEDIVVVLGMASTTGWDTAAIRYLGANLQGASFSHRRVLPCLVDLHSNRLLYNRLDERLKPFLDLFSPAPAEEESERLTRHTEATL